MPTVSVIVPNYNHARFLRQRIDSILAQTYQDFELILLDDCSTDNSREILQEYASDPHVTHVEFNEMNSGSTFKQWNKGVRLAQGKYVWIAESDDYADPRLLTRLVTELDADPSVVFAYCRSWLVSASGERTGFQDTRLAPLDSDRWDSDFRVGGIEECRRSLVRRCSVQTASSVVFRRDVYSQVGGADESLRQCGDWKLWAAMALTGGTISYCGEPLNCRRCHDGSVTEKNRANPQNGVWAAETLHVAAWVLSSVRPRPDMRVGARESLAYFWIPAALNHRLPARTRWAILRDALFIDPYAGRALIRALALKSYYDFLQLTYAPRHALGLCRSRTAQARANGAK